MSKERSAILTTNSTKSKAPIIIGVAVVLAAAIASYFIWLRPSATAEEESGEPDYSKESYEECIARTNNDLAGCRKKIYNRQ